MKNDLLHCYEFIVMNYLEKKGTRELWEVREREGGGSLGVPAFITQSCLEQ